MGAEESPQQCEFYFRGVKNFLVSDNSSTYRLRGGKEERKEIK